MHKFRTVGIPNHSAGVLNGAGIVDDRLHVDPDEIDAIARLGRDACATIRDRFEMVMPNL